MPGDARRHHGCTHKRGSGRAGRPAYGPLERRYGDAPIRLTGASRHVETLDHHSERLAAKGFMSEMTFPEQRAESGRDMSLKGNTTLRFIASLSLLALLAFTAPLPAQPPEQKWVVSWIGSVHGPYPSGNPSAQPDMKLAFPSAETGARDQSFRMIVKPEIWGKEARLRFSNALGTRPVTFAPEPAGLHRHGNGDRPQPDAAPGR